MYVPSAGATIDADAILPHQRRIVGAGQLETLGVENRHVRIEKRHAQPQAFDLGGDPLALLGLDGKIVDVFILHHAVDRRIEIDLLRRGEFVVGLGFFDLRQGPTLKVRRLLMPLAVRTRNWCMPSRQSAAIASLVLTALAPSASRCATVMPGS